MQQHALGTDWVESSFVQKDLGVLVDNDLTTSQQCAFVAKKASNLLDCVRKNIASGQREVILPFSLALVRDIHSAEFSAWVPSTRAT